MKTNKKLKYIAIAVSSLMMVSCTNEFAEINTNPETILDVSPETFFTNAVIGIHENSFEAFYDNYRRIMPWMQLQVPITGNTTDFITNSGNMNSRYGTFYGNVGNNLTNLIVLVDKMPQDQQGKYANMKAIAEILKIYQAFYVSDINGSIAYNEAFQVRYGGTDQPKYDTQEQLFNAWIDRLKVLSATLKNTPDANQVSLAKFDLYYGGDAARWAKAASALRLKIAFRLQKRNEQKLKDVATEVLNSGDLFAGINEEWAFIGGPGFTSHGNYDPTGFAGSKSIIDFMWDKKDPRLALFFRKNAYSQENFDLAKAQGKLPAAAVRSSRQYVGAVASPDAVSQNPRLFASIRIVDASGADITVDTLSRVQQRLWQSEFERNDNGRTTFNVITYAEVCFMRAELLQLYGIGTGSAKEWYEKGIRASVQSYDAMAKTAGIHNYAAVQPADIDAYLTSTGVAFDPAIAIQQIRVQMFLNYFKQPNEAWALYKRTGMPNNNTVLAFEIFKSDGIVQQIPRRAQLPVPDATSRNYNNYKSALEEMQKDPGFGQGASDMFGRVWWDKN
ncbi:SusD/RagB family nutrient-binding outer membrane lipoprotein [Solitalea canadensis]|nr:SusD/RagB family nutrient-binding outer membrane lipoprotein [Solitalea canadensis]